MLSAAAADRLVDAAYKKPVVEREWLAKREREKGNELFKVSFEGPQTRCPTPATWRQRKLFGILENQFSPHRRELVNFVPFLAGSKFRSYSGYRNWLSAGISDRLRRQKKD